MIYIKLLHIFRRIRPKRLRALLTVIAAAMLLMAAPSVLAADAPMDDAARLEEILDRIDERYDRAGFSATFFQSSTLKAMNITDTALGTMTVKRPGKMRWIYEHPEPQTIVTDGSRLWIHQPRGNQVMVGKAPDFFGDGKGASFLSDMRLMREQFHISLLPAEQLDIYRLQLLPRKPALDIARIVVEVSRASFIIRTIATYNAYDDETLIELNDVVFKDDIPDSLFTFTIPEGVEVLQIDP